METIKNIEEQNQIIIISKPLSFIIQGTNEIICVTLLKNQKNDLIIETFSPSCKSSYRTEISQEHASVDDVLNQMEQSKFYFEGDTLVIRIGVLKRKFEKIQLEGIDFQQLELKAIRFELENLKRLMSSPPNNIVWVTTHTDTVEKKITDSTSIELLSFIVNKKEKDTKLLIQGTVSLHGEHNAETTFCWVYDKTTTVLAQSEGYHNNSGYSRSVPTTAVIVNHKKTGPQYLSLTWEMKNAAAGRPCNFINPSGSQHTQLRPSSSVITVFEIFE